MESHETVLLWRMRAPVHGSVHVVQCSKGPVKIGDKVRARFRTKAAATHTCLDLYWELE